MITLKKDQQGKSISTEHLLRTQEVTSVLIYGDSGMGKSTHLAHAAEWLANRYGKPVRVVTIEPSSTIVFSPLVAQGKVELVFITPNDSVFRALRRLSKGEWPSEQGWRSWDGNVCAYIIEGMQSLGEALIEECRHNGYFKGEQKEVSVALDGEFIIPASRSMFGVVQSEILDAIRGFSALDGLRYMLWSAHEAKGIEEDTGVPIRGPALVGTAKTASVPKYFSIVLHFDQFSRPVGTGENLIFESHWRVWLTSHPDPQQPHIKYPAKVVLPMAAKSLFNKQFPLPYFDPVAQEEGDSARLTPSLADVLAAQEFALQAASQKKKEVTGDRTSAE
jgi:hypothetical protein